MSEGVRMPEEGLKPCCKCGITPELWGNGSKACFEKLQIFCPLPKGCGRSTGWLNTKDQKVATKEWDSINTLTPDLTPEEEKEIVEEMAGSVEPAKCSVSRHMEYLHMAEEMLSAIRRKYWLKRKG